MENDKAADMFFAFFIGICLSALLTTILFTTVAYSDYIKAEVGLQHTDEMCYKVTVDSLATDSLFGKQWRYKK